MTPLFNNISIDRFRGLDGLKVKKFRYINIIGGLNGSGKTTLLESLFALIDGNNPMVTFRPFMWRQLTMSTSQQANIMFSGADLSKPITIKSDTRKGSVQLEITYEPQPVPPSTVPMGPSGPSTSTNMGLTVVTSIDGNPAITLHVTGTSANEAMVRADNPGRAIVEFPRAVLFSRRTLDLPNDMADRFTQAVSKHRKKRLLALAHVIAPNVTDLSLLKTGETSTLFAEVAPNELLLPLSFLGDGATAIVNTGLAIMECENGALMIDELDAAIHFTKLRLIWKELFKLAKEMNCQIFAATHSKEAIEAMALALVDNGSTKDLQYMRLDRVSGVMTATTYLHAELTDALASDWEVR